MANNDDSRDYREIIMSHHGLEIIIKGESQEFFAQDLHTKAVITLIEDADVGGWVKHNHGDTDPLSDFCAAILVAVTKLYAYEGNLPEDEKAHVPPLGEIFLPQSKPVHEVLTQIIGYLRESGYLTHRIAGSAEIGPEDPEDLN
jgi:hypothetical protein